MEDNYDKLVLVELKNVVRLLTIIALSEKTQREKIDILSKVGYKPKEIAELLGTTPNTVRVELFSIKKRTNK